MISLYIHIPFCKRKCDYCSFYSVISDYKEEYITSLIRAVEYFGKKTDKKVATVYIGGGTPSLIPPNDIMRIFDSIYKSFEVDKNAEITVEANPESVTAEWLSALRGRGVNRISLGIQSFDDTELKMIGRLHDSVAALKAVELCRREFDNISCDLIFGLPNQSTRSLNASLDKMLSLDIPHISCYNLQLEEGTPITERSSLVPNEDIQSEMYMLVCKTLKSAGFTHYEISNFAKDGYRARHNSIYWTGDDYLGLGPAAHSKIGDTRFWFDADIKKFIDKKDFEFDKAERITDPLFEKIMLGLRTDSGVPLSLLPSSQSFINQLTDGGFAQVADGILRLTDSGFYLSNTIISEITAKEC